MHACKQRYFEGMLIFEELLNTQKQLLRFMKMACKSSKKP